MKIRKTITALALAVAGLGWSAASAGAALVYNTGDLLLAFRASGGDGASTSLLVNIGPATNYLDTTGSFTLSLGTLGSTLQSLYGINQNWYERGDLFWGVFGKTSGGTDTLYGSKARTDVTVQTSAWPSLSTTARNSTGSQIGSVTTAFTGLTQESGLTVAAGEQTNFGGAGSYNFQVTTGGTDFGSLSQWSSIEGNFGAGTDGTVLDLWRIGASVTYRGNFSIDDTGAVSFNAAVPEPSSFALVAIAGTVFTVFRRRRAVRA